MPADLTQDNEVLLSNEDGLAVADNLDPSQPISSSTSGSLNGVRIPGTFTLDTVDDMSFLAGGLGEVRNLVVKMLETDRSTGNFVQLTHKAHLEVECDFAKFVSFNASDNVDDDAYQFLGITLTNDSAVEPDVSKHVSSDKFKLDLNPALAAGEGAPLSGASQRATYANSVLSSYSFPSGAVLIDLGSHSSMSGLSAADRVVTVGASGVNGATATYQVNADKTLIGMTLFAKVIVNCANVSGSPTISSTATFSPSGNILGAGTGIHDSVTIHLINQEDFTTAQDIAVGLGSNTTGSLVGLDVNQANPDANSPDDFDVTIGLASLGGEGDAGSVGKSMIDGIIANVGTMNGGKLLEKFTISVQQIDFDTGSDFSGYMRALATDANRDAPLPINDNEKFIIQTPAKINLNITPFAYSFQSAGLASNVAAFKLIDEMEVYAVLKHVGGSTSKVLQTSDKAVLSA